MSDARQCHPSPLYMAFKGLDTMVPPLAAYRHHHHSTALWLHGTKVCAPMGQGRSMANIRFSHLCFTSLVPSGMGRLIP